MGDKSHLYSAVQISAAKALDIIHEVRRTQILKDADFHKLWSVIDHLLNYLQVASTPEETRDLLASIPSKAEGLGVLRGRHDLDEWIFDYEVWFRSLAKFLNRVPPDRFMRGKLEIRNPDRLSEGMVSGLLDGVDYLIAQLRHRDMTSLLGVIPYITLRTEKESGSNAHGSYFNSDGHIELFAPAVSSKTIGKLSKVWIHEVFLHEFGHFIYYKLLDHGAREYWDSGWDEVKAEERKHQQTYETLTAQEREVFWSMLVKSGYNIGVVKAIKDPLQVIKFGVWLRKPLSGEPLITAKQFRPTNWGKKVFSLLSGGFVLFSEVKYSKVLKQQDPEYQEAYRLYEDWLNSIKERVFGLGHSTKIPEELAIEISNQFSGKGMAEIKEQLIQKLEPVSQYAKTDEQEDFAETFVAWFERSQFLTPTSKFRLLRTLSLSGLYGKSIARIAVQSHL